MEFLIVVCILLALSYVGAMVHAKILLGKGESSSDVETAIVNTGAGVMVLGVVLALFLWPAGKPWYKSTLFAPAYKIASQYLKPNPKELPKGTKLADAEAYYVPIRQILIGSIASIICGLLAQVIVKSQAKSIVSSGSSAPVNRGPRSPWSGQSY